MILVYIKKVVSYQSKHCLLGENVGQVTSQSSKHHKINLVSSQVEADGMVCSLHSLIPRPSPAPVFDHLQQTGAREGLGARVQSACTVVTVEYQVIAS